MGRGGAWPPVTFLLSEGGGIEGGGGIAMIGALLLSGRGGRGGRASLALLSVTREKAESADGLRLWSRLLKASALYCIGAGDEGRSPPNVPTESRGRSDILGAPRITSLF